MIKMPSAALLLSLAATPALAHELGREPDHVVDRGLTEAARAERAQERFAAADAAAEERRQAAGAASGSRSVGGRLWPLLRVEGQRNRPRTTRAAGIARQEAGERLLIERIAGMPAGERAAYAERLREAFRRPRRR